jgi:flagellar motor switch protein FliM
MAEAGAPKNTKALITPEEMTSLLGAKGVAAPEGLKPLTLGAPAPLSKEEERLWSSRLEDSARVLGLALGAMLRREIGAEVLAPRRRRFGDLVAGLTDMTAAAFGPPPTPGAAGLALAIPLPDALIAVDRLLGGGGAARKEAGAPPTALESAVILELGGAIAKALSSADPGGASRWKVDSLVVDRGSMPSIPSHETAFVVDLDLGLADSPMRVAVWIPEGWLTASPSSAAPLAQGEKSRAAAAAGWPDLEATVTAQLDVGWLSLGDALSLRPGDLLRLNPATESRLCVNGVPVLNGTLIRDADPVSFEVGPLSRRDAHD